MDSRVVQAVWEKGRGMPDKDPSEWRQDQCGAWLHRDQLGNEKSEYGWKILKVDPGGADEVENLQIFHCKNSFNIGNHKPSCQITADRTGLNPTQNITEPRNKPV